MTTVQRKIEKPWGHEIIWAQTEKYIGKTVCVLIEKASKRSEDYWSGRTSQNTVAVFPKKNYQMGDFVDVKITSCTSATLIGVGIQLSKSI